jgi:WD40 repeat protein
MTRRFVSFAFVFFCVCSASAATKIADLSLPCESRAQRVSPDGTQVVVRCGDRSLHVLSVPEGKEVRVVSSEQSANSVAYSRDSQWMAVGFHDGAIELAPAKGSMPSKRWQASPRRIDALYFSPDSKVLVVGPADSSGQVWDLAGAPTLRATLPFAFGGINACAMSPDGKLLVVAGDDTVLRWYDTATWQKTLENRDFLLETFALAFTPDGKQVLAGGADARVTVLDAATAKSVRQLPPEAGSYVVALDPFGDQPSAAAFYLDDAGEKPPHQLVWRLADGKSAGLGDGPPTCHAVVGGKLWFCSADGKMLHIAQFE